MRCVATPARSQSDLPGGDLGRWLAVITAPRAAAAQTPDSVTSASGPRGVHSAHPSPKAAHAGRVAAAPTLNRCRSRRHSAYRHSGYPKARTLWPGTEAAAEPLVIGCSHREQAAPVGASVLTSAIRLSRSSVAFGSCAADAISSVKIAAKSAGRREGPSSKSPPTEWPTRRSCTARPRRPPLGRCPALRAQQRVSLARDIDI